MDPPGADYLSFENHRDARWVGVCAEISARTAFGGWLISVTASAPTAENVWHDQRAHAQKRPRSVRGPSILPTRPSGGDYSGVEFKTYMACSSGGPFLVNLPNHLL